MKNRSKAFSLVIQLVEFALAATPLSHQALDNIQIRHMSARVARGDIALQMKICMAFALNRIISIEIYITNNTFAFQNGCTRRFSPLQGIFFSRVLYADFRISHSLWEMRIVWKKPLMVPPLSLLGSDLVNLSWFWTSKL